MKLGILKRTRTETSPKLPKNTLPEKSIKPCMHALLDRKIYLIE